MHLNEIGIVGLTELGWDLIRCLAVVLALLSDGVLISDSFFRSI
jgi:hypothetical protein